MLPGLGGEVGDRGVKISVRLFDGGVEPHPQDVTPENNAVTVRVIVPKA